MALPANKAKDAVGLIEHHPPFEIADAAPALLTGRKVGAFEGSGEGLDLLGGEAEVGWWGQWRLLLRGGGLSPILGICFTEHLDHRWAWSGGRSLALLGGPGAVVAVAGGAVAVGGKQLGSHGWSRVKERRR